MMSDHDALFRAILANPDDDPLRLVYADWVEEYGDPKHARFIRSQIETARLPPWDPVWIRANWIERTTGYPNDFSVPYVRLPEGLSWLGGMYRRGFPSAVQSRGVQPLLRHADEMFTLAPVDELEIGAVDTWGPLDLTELAHAPWFGRIHRLKLILATLDQASIISLQNLPHVVNLTDLDVETCALSPDTFAELFQPPLITRLRRLAVHVSDQEIDLAPLVLKAGGPHQLRSLRLTAGSNHESPRQLIGTGVFDAPLFQGLAELDLSDNLLGPNGIDALVASSAVVGLESLTLDWTRIGVDEVRVLANSPVLASLRRLELSNNQLLPAAATVIARSKHFANLRVLNLDRNWLTNASAAAIARSPHLGELAFLDLGFNQLGDDAAQKLMDSPLADRLTFLRLVMNKISGPMKRKLRSRLKERVVY